MSDIIKIIQQQLDDVIKKYNEKTTNFETELEAEIEGLVKLCGNMEELANKLIASKVGVKSLSELYNSILSVKKCIIDVKEKKYKLNENLLRNIKTMLDSVVKNNAVSGNEKNATLDVTQFIKDISKDI